MRKALLRTPLEFSRVSSAFGMRKHPFLQSWRAHQGVDYAAPAGTRVRAVGDGVVEFAGRQGGYGNMVILRHDSRHTTVYAHLKAFGPGIRSGARVVQGATVGQVGQTGWATGPHLHYEFKIAGVHQDPMTIVAQSEAAAPVSAAARPAFDRLAANMRVQLSAAALFEQASAD